MMEPTATAISPMIYDLILTQIMFIIVSFKNWESKGQLQDTYNASSNKIYLVIVRTFVEALRDNISWF